VIDQPNYITPDGLAKLRARYRELFDTERPKIVETVSWAAGNGDRSENGDYIYGKRRLREIDRELGWLSKRMKAARVVDPAEQPDRSRVWFGDDEQDVAVNRIGWNAPIARALRSAAVGDLRRVTLPGGETEYEIIQIRYPGP
jgi:transcription elongation factor GreB